MSLEELLDILRNGNLSEIDTSEAAFEVESTINQIKELHAAYYKTAQERDELLNEATKRATQFAAVTALITASNRAIAAFEAYGDSRGLAVSVRHLRECETAMAAQKVALANIGITP